MKRYIIGRLYIFSNIFSYILSEQLSCTCIINQNIVQEAQGMQWLQKATVKNAN